MLSPLILPNFLENEANISTRKVVYGFFSRQGGASEGVYNSLNAALQSADNPLFIQKNRELVRDYFVQEVLRSNPLGNQNSPTSILLMTLTQKHTASCWITAEITEQQTVNQSRENRLPIGDGLVSDKPGELIAVVTADCAPVLFVGHKKSGEPVVGAAHAGWQGALNGICEATIEKMVALGAEKQTIRAAIGPCLGQENFEVAPSFPKQFIDISPDSAQFFHTRNEKVFFNFEAYVDYRLRRSGIRNIALSGIDTYAHADKYFSYRRSTHLKEPDYGRQISAIMVL